MYSFIKTIISALYIGFCMYVMIILAKAYGVVYTIATPFIMVALGVIWMVLLSSSSWQEFKDKWKGLFG